VCSTIGPRLLTSSLLLLVIHFEPKQQNKQCISLAFENRACLLGRQQILDQHSYPAVAGHHNSENLSLCYYIGQPRVQT
ncbi:hypothetical protein CABS01_08646, partial [Colletotrichum abscissum]|uniref:uncharacterized protein n=1 Tax=Colletotrichum abscissum TaxID=1671311 RepID=UPI0027D749DD